MRFESHICQVPAILAILAVACVGTPRLQDKPVAPDVDEAVKQDPATLLDAEDVPWLYESEAWQGLSIDADDPISQLSRESLLAEADRMLVLSESDPDSLWEEFSRLLQVTTALERKLDHTETPAIEILVRLEGLYNTLGNPFAVDVMSRGMVVELSSELCADGDWTPSEVEPVLRQAQALQRQTAASLLRLEPNHPSVPVALRNAAKIFTADAAFEKAKALNVEAVRRAGSAAGIDEWADLAGACYRALETECGDRAREYVRDHVRGSGDEAVESDTLEELDEIARQVRIVQATEDDPTLQVGLDRARALSEIGRKDLARREYERLCAGFPEDARPVVGLGRLVWVESIFSPTAVEPYVNAASALGNKDGDFYELAILHSSLGVLRAMMHMMQMSPATTFDEGAAEVTSAMAALRSYLPDYERFRPGFAQALGLLLECLDRVAESQDQADDMGAVLRPIADSVLDRATALRGRYPDEALAHELALSAAVLTTDSEAALAVTLASNSEPSSRPESVALLRARTLLKLIVEHDRSDLLDTLRGFVEEVPLDGEHAYDAAMLHGMLLALEARAGRAETAWQDAAAFFEEALAQAEGEPLARAANNLGVALQELDRTQEASRMWDLVRLGVEDPLGILQINAIVGSGRESAEVREELKRVVENQELDGQLKSVVSRWMEHLSRGGAAQNQSNLSTTAELTASSAATVDQEDYPLGVVFRSAASVGPQISPGGEQFTVSVDMHVEAWLYLVAPGGS